MPEDDDGAGSCNARDYPLGDGEHEVRRLADQAGQLEDYTANVLRAAGVRRGMRVLDLGSGVGDVAFLTARLVGADGAVVGIEKSASSIELARGRISERGLANVTFVHSDIDAFVPDGLFDAVIGRFVLSYLPDRIAALRASPAIFGLAALPLFWRSIFPRSHRFRLRTFSSRRRGGWSMALLQAEPNWTWGRCFTRPSWRPAFRRRR